MKDLIQIHYDNRQAGTRINCTERSVQHEYK